MQLRSVPEGIIRRTLNLPGPILALAFSPDGRYLASASTSVKLLDTQSGAVLEPHWPHPQPVEALVFNRKGDRLATACRDKKVRVFAVADPNRPAPLFAPVDHVPVVPSPPAFVDEGRGLITIRSGQQVNWWDAESGRPVGFQIVTSRPFALQRVVSSPRGDWFAVAGYWSAQVWTTADRGSTSLVLDHVNLVRDLTFGKDGKTLLTASDDHTARLWSLPDGKPLTDSLRHMENISACATSDDSYLATARADGQVRVWKRPAPYAASAQRAEWGSRPRLSPNGRLLAPGFWHETSSESWSVARPEVLDAATGKPAAPAFPVPGTTVDSAVCTDNETLAAVSVKETVGYLTFWDVPTGRRLFEPMRLPAVPQSVAIRPQTSQVAVLCRSDRVLIVDCRTGERIREVAHEGGRGGNLVAPRAEYTPDGKSLVTLSCDATALHVWDAETGKLRYPLIRPALGNGPGDRCRSFALSANGKLLATAVNGKNAAQVWDLTTGQALSQPLPHPGDDYGLFHVCFSSDGRFLLTACKDGQARFWDWQAGALACPTFPHRWEVWAVALTADGRYALTTNKEGLHVWELTTGKRMAPPIPFPAGIQALARAPDGTRAYACYTSTVVLLPLDELLVPPQRPTDDFALLGAVSSGQRIEQDDVSGLTGERWLECWERFQQTQAEEKRPTWTKALARSITYRQTARRHLEEGRPLDAVTAWRQARLEIDRAPGSEHDRRPQRAEILQEARALLEGLLTAQPENAAVAAALAGLLIDLSEPAEWTVLVPTQLKSTDGATLKCLPDGSILASGTSPIHDTYLVEARASLRGITALRLEALPEPGLVRNGPGRSVNGNFCLTEISLAVVPGTPGPPQRSRLDACRWLLETAR